MRRIRWIGFLCLLGLIGLTLPVMAEEQEGGMSFTYTNKQPDNQLKAGNYFDLLMTPGQEQVLETELVNLSDEDLTINVIVSNATTTELGVIDYGPNKQANTENLTYGLADLVTAPKSIELPKNGKATLKLQVKMPEEAIPGVVLGGIQLQQELANQETKEQILAVNNQYAYVYSLSLRENEDLPAFEFQSQATTVKSINGQTEIAVNMANLAPRIIKEMGIETIVTPKESEKVLAEQSLKDAKMAPNSIISLPLALGELGSGEYQTTTTVEVGDERWKWVEAFTVEKTEATQPVVEQEKQQKQAIWLPVFIIASVLIVGTGVLYIVIRKY